MGAWVYNFHSRIPIWNVIFDERPRVTHLDDPVNHSVRTVGLCSDIHTVHVFMLFVLFVVSLVQSYVHRPFKTRSGSFKSCALPNTLYSLHFLSKWFLPCYVITYSIYNGVFVGSIVLSPKSCWSMLANFETSVMDFTISGSYLVHSLIGVTLYRVQR